jgi:hypothetical protein
MKGNFAAPPLEWKDTAMPGMEPGSADASVPLNRDVTTGLGATGAGLGMEPEAAKPPAAPLHLPWPAYAGIAALALPAEALAPVETPPGERPFVGYDRERAAYARLRPELLDRAEGRYVVLVGDEIEGPVDTFEEALRAGWRRFGLGPLYVRQIAAEEPAVEAAGDPSCPS